MSKIFVAGHKGMVGSSICRQLESNSNNEIITSSRSELNLLNQEEVLHFFTSEKFDQIYLAAAKVGGIHANNTYPAEFIYENLMIQNNVIHSAYLSNVQKLLFLGSSCIYPKFANQPIKEKSLLNGHLEPTNEPYAIAKIAGIKLCESYNRQYHVDYRSLMPTNLYGPGDNYQNENSHVVPALIRRFYKAKVDKSQEVVVWGSGRVYRDFLHVDDMANASIYVMNLDKSLYDKITTARQSHINAGSGLEISIKELAEKIAKTVGFHGSIRWDETKPDGTPRKLLDNSILSSLGWEPSYDIDSGLKNAFEHYKNDLALD